MYTPEVGGVGEARLFALRDMIRSRIARLQTAFSRDSHSSYLLSPPFSSSLDPNIVCNVGDVQLTWDTGEGAVKISVISGSEGVGGVWSGEWETIERSTTHGISYTYTTSIYAYFHPNAFISREVKRSLEKREICIARLDDWLRADVFNAPYYSPTTGDYRPADIPLTSQEYHDSGYDRLTRCFVTNGSVGQFTRGFGNSEVLFGIHLLHTGHIG